MKIPATLLLLALSTTMAAQTPAQTPESVTLPAPMDRVLRDYEKAWRAKDPAALAALFAEDGCVMPNGAPPACGREAIRAQYENAGGPLVLRAIRFHSSGDAGYILGGFSSDGTQDQGKFVLALKRDESGKWLIAADMDNMNRRPRPAGSSPAP